MEKAGVDEVFLDLSRLVHDRMLAKFPEELSGPPPYNDPSENLSMPGVTVLDWKADALVDLDEGLTEEDDPDVCGHHNAGSYKSLTTSIVG